MNARRRRRYGIDEYMREVDALELTPLTPEQERQLIIRASQGDEEAGQRLILHSLPFVVSFAMSFRGGINSRLEFIDLVQEGNFGLIDAVSNFDTSMSTRFSSYAKYHVVNRMIAAVRNTNSALHIPVHVPEYMSRLKRARRNVVAATGKVPSQKTLISMLEFKPTTIKCIRAAERAIQLQQWHNGDIATLDKLLGDCDEPDVEIDRRLDKIRLRNALRTLPAREAEVLVMRFGLFGEEPLTLKQVSEHIHVCLENVRVIESKALRRLTDRLRFRVSARLFWHQQ